MTTHFSVHCPAYSCQDRGLDRRRALVVASKNIQALEPGRAVLVVASNPEHWYHAGTNVTMVEYRRAADDLMSALTRLPPHSPARASVLATLCYLLDDWDLAATRLPATSRPVWRTVVSNVRRDLTS